MNAQTKIDPQKGLLAAFDTASADARFLYEWAAGAMIVMRGQADRLERHGEDVSATRAYLAKFSEHYASGERL